MTRPTSGGAVAGEDPFVSIIEFYVTPFDVFVYDRPEESVESELYAGKTIGFRFHVFDVRGRDVGDGSVVRADSWGRIKASLGN